MKVLGGIIRPAAAAPPRRTTGEAGGCWRCARGGVAFIHQELDLYQPRRRPQHPPRPGTAPPRGEGRRHVRAELGLAPVAGFRHRPAHRGIAPLHRTAAGHRDQQGALLFVSPGHRGRADGRPHQPRNRHPLRAHRQDARRRPRGGLQLHRFEELLRIGGAFGAPRRPIGGVDADVELRPRRGDPAGRPTAGRDLPRTHRARGEPVLQLSGVRLAERAPPIDLVVRRGEVVGWEDSSGPVARSPPSRCSGCAPSPAEGCATWVRPSSGRGPGVSAAASPTSLEDGKVEGLMLGMKIRENVTLSSLAAVARFGLVSPRREGDAADGSWRTRRRGALAPAVHRHPERWQPAALRARQVARHEASAPHARRADPQNDVNAEARSTG